MARRSLRTPEDGVMTRLASARLLSVNVGQPRPVTTGDHPIIERELPRASAPDAHRAVMDHEARGKIVLIP